MEQLTNAPLIEVICEIAWDSNSKKEIDKFQILAGSISADLKDVYSYPENLIPDPGIPINIFLNKPIYRFRNKNNNNILFQLGPGTLSVNHVGKNYQWDQYLNEITTVIISFQKLYDFPLNKKISLGLKYLDFFEVNAAEVNIFQYIKDNLHIGLSVEGISDFPGKVAFSTSYKQSENIFFSLSLNSADINKEGKKQNGLLLESAMNTTVLPTAFQDWKKLTIDFHSFLSSFFQNITKGNLYNSFK